MSIPFVILCTISLCLAFPGKAEKLNVTSVCQNEKPCAISYTTSWKEEKGKSENSKLFLTYIDPRCLTENYWCEGSCAHLKSIDVSNRLSDTQTYACGTIVNHVAHFHTDDIICAWSKSYNTDDFKAVVPNPKICTDAPSRNDLYYLFFLLLIPIIPLMCCCCLRCISNKIMAETRKAERTSEIQKNVPFFDLNTSANSLAKDEIALGRLKNSICYDPIQTLSPVYKSTHSQTHINMV